VLQEEPIGQWLIKRNVDGKDKTDYAFDQNFLMKPGAKIRVSMICVRLSISIQFQ